MNNLTTNIYAWDHSDPICDLISTSILYSLSKPDAGIRTLTLIPLPLSPDTFRSQDFNYGYFLFKHVVTPTQSANLGN